MIYCSKRVHYNSDKPAQLQALAYTQGNQVYVASGQEKHLGHELGHVVQQKEGRVMPTISVNELAANDNALLESEAGNYETIQQKRVFSYNQAAMKMPFQMKSIIQRETDLKVQQGPSCWLYVLEALMKSKLDDGGKKIGTKYLSMAMTSYTKDRDAIVARQASASSETPSRTIDISYKDPNYGNYKIKINQLKDMAKDKDITIRTFLPKSGKNPKAYTLKD